MHIIETISGLKRYIPADLSECDSQQYIDMCQLIFAYHTQQLTSDELLTHAVYKLMNMKHVESKNETAAKEKAVNVILIRELIESTFFEKIEAQDGNFQYKIIQNYIDNPVPSFKPLCKTYYGPTEAFKNIKVGEYVDALRLYQEFNVSGEIRLLYELAATLYRPKKAFHFIKKRLSSYDGDCRIKYNANQLEKRTKALKYGSPGFVYGVYLYFASFHIILSSGQIPWGDKTLDLSILYNETSDIPEIEAQDIGLDSLIFSVAESGTFGDFEKVQQLPFWTMIIKMYDARVKQLQQDKIQENANNQPPS